MIHLRLVSRPRIDPLPALPEAALNQDGVFTRAQARREGWTDGRQARLLRRGTWVHVTPQVLRHHRVELGPWQAARAVSLSGGRVVSHTTAAALWGLQVPSGLHGVRRNGREIRGIRDHRMLIAERHLVACEGLVVTGAPRTLADLLCLLDQEASVVCLTDAFRRGVLSPQGLRRDVAPLVRGRTGAPRAREVIASCAGRPYSLLEWHAHQVLGRAATGWRFNVPLRDLRGLIGHADAVHDVSRVVVEFDGRQFHGADRFQSDRSRDQRLAAAGHLVLRFTWDDVRDRPDEVVATIRTVIAQRSPG